MTFQNQKISIVSLLGLFVPTNNMYYDTRKLYNLCAFIVFVHFPIKFQQTSFCYPPFDWIRLQLHRQKNSPDSLKHTKQQ